MEKVTIKKVLLETTWGGTINSSNIEYNLNGGMGAWPIFENEKLKSLINDKISTKTLFSLLQNDEEVKNHFIKIGHQNFLKEEIERKDFKNMIRSIFGFNNKEEYIEMSNESYFKEIFIENDEHKTINYLMDNSGKFYLYS